jgi:extracellular factor (EF) 3-hydroxypalmitic acid methyl ester biosynthesis protein
MTTTLLKQPAISKLISFIQSGGPEESQYDELTTLWDELDTNGNGATLDEIRSLFNEEFLSRTLHGFIYRKPHGYAGDFEIIDYIYRQATLADESFEKWDKYVHFQHAPKAVRNRKRYFIDLVKHKCVQLDVPLRILNIACGPCRDLKELLDEIPVRKLNVRCIDIDPDAIEYAKKVLGPHAYSIDFTRANIFKFNTDQRFDLVWSAGLFDYFNDSDFIKLLLKVSDWCAPGGEIVIGNFSVFNPTRAYMEKALDWYLFHRTEDQLLRLALEAGIKPNSIEVKSEPLGVNLFLHIRLP